MDLKVHGFFFSYRAANMYSMLIFNSSRYHGAHGTRSGHRKENEHMKSSTFGYHFEISFCLEEGIIKPDLW